MDQNRTFSGEAYEVENGKVTINDLSKDPNYIVLDTVDTNKNTIGNEKNPKQNSMQAMVVAEIKNEFKDYDIDDLKDLKGYPESVIKQDITIAYAGTAGWQDMKTDIREIARNDKHENGAFQSALSYANEIEKRYSVKDGYTISTTGHSLGGAEAIYVSVLKGYNAITYGAAGSGLTEEQLKLYKGTIVNIYDTSDIVTSGLLTGGQGKIPFLSIGIDNEGWKTAGHSRDQFKLDKNGNYVNKYGEIAVYSDLNGGISIEQTILAQQIIANNQTMRGIEERLGNTKDRKLLFDKLMKENKLLQAQINSFTKINQLRLKFKTSGGVISTNEQIYLDDSEALTVVQSASAQFESAMESTIKIYKEGILELEELWQKALSKAKSATPDLSYGEMLDTLNSVECTEQSIVTVSSEEFREKIAKAKQMSEKFTRLVSEIKSKIAELVQRDQELARQLG
ncbi:triacylglycerol lipase [Carnobacterium divergens]|uniref:Triacylglycerol lipase n=1 Tax=Carnobacterium divergens TaxID=2748 RepID=A0AAW8RDN3_CARDV|nr:triacylglycerol lipase [Carnobacterium divergens]MDT1959308.1 triacylglycerol lipase [Carnobacterium divergens]MDT1975232.1 triacylglycerol lipase [Carnobacterium divergens]